MDWLSDAVRWLGMNWTNIGNLIFAAVVAWTAWVGM